MGTVGALAGVPELAVSFGLIEEPAYQEFTALAYGGLFVGGAATVADALRALYERLGGGSCGG